MTTRAWDCATANVHDTHFQPLLAQFDGQRIVLTDTGFHAKTGDPVNMKVCPRGTWNTRMLVETVLSMLTTVFHSKKVGHRVWASFRARVAWTMAAEDLPAQHRGRGFGVLALASALGTGLSAIIQATVLSPLDASWRWLYVMALPFVLLVVMLNRSLPESARYEAVAARHDATQGHAGLLAKPPFRRPFDGIAVRR